MVLNQRNVSLSVYLGINIQTNPIASRDKTGKRIICVTFHQCIGCRFNRRVIHIHGQYLSHLRFADYIIILAESPNDLEEILSSLDDSSIREGLGMNINKTKFMHNRYVFRDSQPKWRYNQDCARIHLPLPKNSTRPAQLLYGGRQKDSSGLGCWLPRA